MTEMQLREEVVSTAAQWLGFSEVSGKHKVIIDLYNTLRPLPRGYKVLYDDAWCATFVSAVAVKCGLTDIIPPECGCEDAIRLFQQLGRWQENDGYTPLPGDVIFYDWQDSGAGYNRGVADHVGIVESVSGGAIKVIEGNKSESVGYRMMAVDGAYIRGFGVPDYAGKVVQEPPGAVIPVGANDEVIWSFLRGCGLNAFAAAGVMGNLFAESGLLPNNLQNSFEQGLGFSDASYTAAVDSGEYGGFTRDGAGYGLAQWTFWSRKQALLAFARSRGVSVGDLRMQLDFLWGELQGYTAVMSVLCAAGSVREASDVVLTQFERPADMGEAVKLQRAAFGQGYFDRFAQMPVSPEPDDPVVPTIPEVPKPPSDWAEAAWAWAMNAGITDGSNPHGYCTREQAVTMLHRFSRLI